MHVKVELLKHPYPYKCSFTISNDCDYMNRESFDSIHRFINTTNESRLGKGLGLPIADTMFMYCQRPGGLSYFDGVSNKLSRDSSFLIDAVKEGWIDSLHGYGDFVKSNVFSRKMAERALEELDRKNIKFRVWIDHGSADNSQNFCAPNVLSKGDNPKHKSYHTDLLRQYGVTFCAGYNSDRIGQDAKNRYLAKPLPQHGVPFSFLKRIHGTIYGERLLRERRVRDNNRFYFFCRARNGVLRPDVTTLCHQLSRQNVQKLIQSGGKTVLYQHLGSAENERSTYPYLGKAARRALANIAQKYAEGEIWVAPTSELLTYAYLLRNVKLGLSHNQDALSVEIKSKDRLWRHLDRADLRNLSFRISNYYGDKIRLRCDNYVFEDTEYERFRDRGIVIKLNPR